MVYPPFKYQGNSIYINQERYWAIENRDHHRGPCEILYFAKACPLLPNLFQRVTLDEKDNHYYTLGKNEMLKKALIARLVDLDSDRGWRRITFVYTHWVKR